MYVSVCGFVRVSAVPAEARKGCWLPVGVYMSAVPVETRRGCWTSGAVRVLGPKLQEQ